MYENYPPNETYFCISTKFDIISTIQNNTLKAIYENIFS